MNEQPSIFDQLTPSDALRDDFEYLDRLERDRAAPKPPRPPRTTGRRRRKPADTDDTEHGIEKEP